MGSYYMQKNYGTQGGWGPWIFDTPNDIFKWISLFAAGISS